MVVSAERGEIAFAGDPAVVPGDGVVQVAAGGGAAAARRGAPGVAGADQVGQLAAGTVARLGTGVVARTPGDGGQRGRQDAWGPGAGRVAAGQAGVGGGGAVGVQ